MTSAVDVNLKKSLIKEQACFAQLTDEETKMLASLLVEKHFAPGETIVTEGDPVNSVYLIVSGTAEVRHVSLQDNGARTQIESIATLKENDAIGLNETGFYSISGVRTATVVALTDMVTLSLSVAAFRGFSLAYPRVNEIMRKQAENMGIPPSGF